MHPDADRILCLGELEGIGEQVVQKLGNAQRIGLDKGTCLYRLHREGLVLHLGLNDIGRKTVAQALFQIHGLQVEGKLALLHARQLQDVVNELLELIAGKVNAIQIALHVRPVVCVALGQFRHADDGIQGRAHFMGDIAEKVLPRPCALPGHFQAFLEQLVFLNLGLLLCVYVPEAEHDLFGSKRLVKEQAHIDPAVFVVEQTPEIPTKVTHAPGDQLADIGAGKGQHELAARLGCNDVLHYSEESVVVALLGQPLAHIVRALDHLVGLLAIVDAVEGIEGIAQHAHGIIGPPDQGIVLELQPGKQHGCETEGYDGQQKKARERVDVPQDVPERNGHYGVPAIGQLRIVDHPLVALVVLNVGIIGIELTGADLRQQSVQVLGHLFPALLQLCMLIEHCALAVAEKEGIAPQQVIGLEIELEALRVDVKGQDHIAPGAPPRQGNDRSAGHGIGIDIRVDGLSRRFEGLPVPFALFNIEFFWNLAAPGINILAIANDIGGEAVMAQYGLQMPEVQAQ